MPLFFIFFLFLACGKVAFVVSRWCDLFYDKFASNFVRRLVFHRFYTGFPQAVHTYVYMMSRRVCRFCQKSAIFASRKKCIVYNTTVISCTYQISIIR